ncbi:Uncharacterised protein [Odoribacter splanchnicus]|nr:Uncharacterised protein [Odoribacter splanchnicus]
MLFKVCFNSTLVQLKVKIIRIRLILLPCFNSTLVQLKDGFLCHKDLSLFSFNSTLVQLKAAVFTGWVRVNNVSILP